MEKSLSKISSEKKTWTFWIINFSGVFYDAIELQKISNIWLTKLNHNPLSDKACGFFHQIKTTTNFSLFDFPMTTRQLIYLDNEKLMVVVIMIHFCDWKIEIEICFSAFVCCQFYARNLRSQENKTNLIIINNSVPHSSIQLLN